MGDDNTEKEGVGDILMDFAEYTTLHAVNRIVSKRKRLNIFNWKNIVHGLAFGCGVGFVCFIMGETVVDIYDYPTTTNSRVDTPAKKGDVDFPAVTFCNDNKYIYKDVYTDPNSSEQASDDAKVKILAQMDCLKGI